MLISRRKDRLVLVHQADHARLAGDLCAHWGNRAFNPPGRPESAQIAAEMHDDGWREADAQPLFNRDQQRPLHFLEIEMEDHIALYRSGVEAAFERDPYAGLLVSMHWTGLYRARWGMQTGRVLRMPGSPHVQRMQDEVVASEEARWIREKASLVAEARRSDFEAELWNTFDLLQAWDLVSLFICLSNLSPPERHVEPKSLIPTLKAIDHEAAPLVVESVPCEVAGKRADLTLRAVEEGVVAVEPYPFDEDAVDFEVSAMAIPEQRFESHDDAREAIAAGEQLTLACTLTRQ
jgi:Protein of unknown function (DUF3891)